ncbi:hypothetical protein RFI_11248 [Reticulomyxa filosa]|uniref:Uncharacterized protein n=1 Tax=Reticulomyxa filosa TaxID=46433 RepID=X6NJK8_RETFI|nr:hypothetical protein RFI_11248 [Reticulomyxa filosa]|eukprot:ETO25889.1 hypothetical protein RFI_11248 [Reticulomyxa filosa]
MNRRQPMEQNTRPALVAMKPQPQSQRSVVQVKEVNTRSGSASLDNVRTHNQSSNMFNVNQSPNTFNANQPSNMLNGKEYDKKTVVEKTKFSNEKFTTTWTYLGSDQLIHTVVLRHNVKINNKGVSKRVILVDNVVKYNDKSSDTKFYVKAGRDNLEIEIMANKDIGFKYDLTINGEKFDTIRRQFMIQKASKMSGN